MQQQPLLVEEEEQPADEEELFDINDEPLQNDLESIGEEENDAPELDLEEDSDSDDDDLSDEDQEDQTVVIEDAPAPDVTFNETTNLLDANDDELGGDDNIVPEAPQHVTADSSVDASPRGGSDKYNLRKRPAVNYTFYSRSSNNQVLHKTIRIIKKKDIKGNPKKTKTKKKVLLPMKSNIIDTFRDTVNIIMTQMSGKAGINKHGQSAIDALFKEYAQLNDQSVFKGLVAQSLTKEQKRQALRIIEIIKEKRDGMLKGRACADGRPQRKFVSKEESASPTVSLEGLMLSLMIDAKEGRDVATADVAGAYLHAIMDDFVIVKLTGKTIDIMCDVNPDLRKLVVIENGIKVLYLQLVKALYGCIKSALLWYECFSSCLKGLGFTLNPHDLCVANKLIDGKQCTIVWYVDDCKISHVDSKVVDSIISQLEDKYGKMTITRGSKHVYIGMELEFLSNGRVKVLMKDHLEECFEIFGEEIKPIFATPASHNLFDVDENAQLLDKKSSEIFHRIVAKLLFVCKRSRLDVQLPIAFLCSRVSCSTTQDWLKLKRLLGYLKRTVDMPRIISGCNFDALYTYVDASYATHKDMKSHTGGLMSFGLGVINTKSSKQKINTKSSTEAELVGASDYMPWTLWTKWFLQAQGYTVNQNIFYQDNQSTMKLAQNGIMSSSEKTRHINIRYFFIKDTIKREEIDLQYCPTESMVADFFTKPLQGKLFKYLRNMIMGITPLTLEERVEKHEKSSVKKGKKSNSETRVNTPLWRYLTLKRMLSRQAIMSIMSQNQHSHAFLMLTL